PVSGTVAFTDQQGFTPVTKVEVGFTGNSADSVRFALLADTAAAPWTVLHAVDSLTLTSADGMKIAAAQFKNKFGTRSAWVRDTTRLDRTPPALNVVLNSVYGYLTWNGALSGKALDALSGTDTVFVTKHRDADGFEYNG